MLSAADCESDLRRRDGGHEGSDRAGKALSELSTRVTVPDVPVIGLEAGEYHVQRLIYHLFLKCFWNPDLAFDENAAINYDWYILNCQAATAARGGVVVHRLRVDDRAPLCGSIRHHVRGHRT